MANEHRPFNPTPAERRATELGYEARKAIEAADACIASAENAINSEDDSEIPRNAHLLIAYRAAREALHVAREEMAP